MFLSEGEYFIFGVGLIAVGPKGKQIHFSDKSNAFEIDGHKLKKLSIWKIKGKDDL